MALKIALTEFACELKRECEALTRIQLLGGHPHVVRLLSDDVLDAGSHWTPPPQGILRNPAAVDRNVAIALELCSDGDLERFVQAAASPDFVEENGPMPESIACYRASPPLSAPVVCVSCRACPVSE